MPGSAICFSAVSLNAVFGAWQKLCFLTEPSNAGIILLVLCQAVQQAGGRQRQAFDAWQRRLTSCLASVEAVIDFGEDEQLGEDVLASVLPRADALASEMDAELAHGRFLHGIAELV